MQELLLVNPSPRMSNPRRRRRSAGGKRRASAKQVAWRRKFAQMYGGGRKRRASNPKRRRKARFGKTMRSVARKGGGAVGRASWRASGYRRNPRRRYRRNPAFRLPNMAGVTRTVTQAAQGAIGATLVDLVVGQLSSRGLLPQFVYTDIGYPVMKGALAIGTAALAEAVLPSAMRGIAAEMAKGSITITLAGVIRQFMPAALPLGAARRFGYGGSGYVPSGRPSRALSGMGEYLSGPSEGSMSMREMDAYGPGYVASSLGRTGEYLSR